MRTLVLIECYGYRRQIALYLFAGSKQYVDHISILAQMLCKLRAKTQETITEVDNGTH